MTEQQQTAILSPCRVAEQCSDERYRALHQIQPTLYVSVVLTVNVGEE